VREEKEEGEGERERERDRGRKGDRERSWKTREENFIYFLVSQLGTFPLQKINKQTIRLFIVSFFILPFSE
jgi:hypothetical protein